MNKIGTIQSIQVGKPARYPIPAVLESTSESWRTSFFRSPDPQPRWLFTTHLEGNEQADKKNHGKPGQAVLLYAASHYPLWQEELDRPEIGPGGFGENLTVADLTEETVCIGDIYAIGEARIQVSGPRYPCTKIERRWASPGLTDRAAATGRTGWYCSVLQEGRIEPGLPLMLIERPYPEWTVALVNDFAHSRNHDIEKAMALAACPLLNEFWGPLVVKRARSR